eukprot:COSAG02_NODE_364_length_23758_cov_17.250011_18_plen_104_part_00
MATCVFAATLGGQPTEVGVSAAATPQYMRASFAVLSRPRGRGPTSGAASETACGRGGATSTPVRRCAARCVPPCPACAATLYSIHNLSIHGVAAGRHDYKTVI